MLCVALLAVVGCGIDPVGRFTGEGGGTDSGTLRVDGGPGRDTGPPVEIDAGPPVEIDAGPPESDAGPTCVPTGDPSDDCDTVDDDCDGAVDEDCVCTPGEIRTGCGPCGDGTETCLGIGWTDCVLVTMPATYYADADGDGYGDATMSSELCAPATGYTTDATDCDDTCPTCNPGAAEACNTVDDDCDTMIDEGVLTAYYHDVDRDGFGDMGSETFACAPPDRTWITTAGDCDDACSRCRPGFPEEICGDMRDNDCDGDTDESSCPCDWLRTASGTYTYCRPTLSYTAARPRCLALGGYLASFETRAENDAVWALVDPYNTWAWIGASDMRMEGAWVWESAARICGGGAPAPACSSCGECRWEPGQPNGGDSDDCGVWRVDWMGRWGDIDCTTEYPFVCELT